MYSYDQYILVTQLLEQATEADLLSAEELWTARRLALERYCPETVWEMPVGFVQQAFII